MEGVYSSGALKAYGQLHRDSRILSGAHRKSPSGLPQRLDGLMMLIRFVESGPQDPVSLRRLFHVIEEIGESMG